MQGKIGIVGFGVVGKSVLNFFEHNINNKSVSIDLWDQKELDLETRKTLAGKVSQIYSSANQTLEEFIKSHDYILPSPGVNLNDFYAYKSKFICELDLFDLHFKKPAIAITGSLGKTTTTKLLGQLAAVVRKSDGKKWLFGDIAALNPFTGGNVGLGMLDAIEQKESFDLGVLEISSFQLEFSKTFAPHVAILTNCYPNHLDRHKTLQNYLQAKINLLRYQSSDQYAIMSDQILGDELIDTLRSELKYVKSHVCFSFSKKPDIQSLKDLGLGICKIFYKQDNSLICYDIAGDNQEIIFDLSILPEVTFIENWIQVLAALYLLGADMGALQKYFHQAGFEFAIDDHHHRVEYFATIDGVDFYDDSKATVIQSTLAATKRLSEKGPVILILGGLGKGVDRSPLCQDLAKISNLKKVYCFGPECKDFEQIACKWNTLEDIVADVKQIMKPGDQVVLSPSGTSFDFYKNYKERGQIFKELVRRS